MTFALLSCAASLGQSRPRSAAPFALMPVRTAWSHTFEPDQAAAVSFAGSAAYVSTADGQLAAYDLHTGRLNWTVTATVTRPPASGDGLLFLAAEDAVTARRLSNGAEAWRVPFPDPLASDLVWDNGWLIAATSSGAIVAMRATDGRTIWRRDLGAPAHARPALAADRVYVPTTDNRVVALLVTSGEVVWESPIGGPANDLLALDDRIYAGSNDNRFYCLLASSGRIDWAWPAGGDVIGRPAVDDERVYVVALDNVLRALDRRTGNQRWKQTLPLRPAGGPLLVGDSLVVPGVGPLHAFARQTGAPAGALTESSEELAALPHPVPGAALPSIALATHALERGTIVKVVSRSVEPALAPLGPLPNPVKPPLPE